VIRGGNWNNNASNCRSANRNADDPTNRNNNIGFRVVPVAASLRANRQQIARCRICRVARPASAKRTTRSVSCEPDPVAGVSWGGLRGRLFDARRAGSPPHGAAQPGDGAKAATASGGW
jgi:hypothetical protein